MRVVQRKFSAVLGGLALVCLLVCLVAAQPARAVTLLRDPDIENALKQLGNPILQAAGLSPSRVKILVIRDATLNAFVVDSNHIFIHSGLILKLTTPEQLQAVIAHEAAHIANGHLTRRVLNARVARNVSGIGLALAAAAAASGNTKAATAIGLGVSGSAQRIFMHHTRAEESSADQSAVRFMKRANVSPKGLVDLMLIFRGQELVSEARMDPYARTHPMSRDRLRRARSYADGVQPKTGSPNSDYWFSRAKGKLSAFIRAPKWTRQRINDSASEDIKLMRQAVAFHRESKTTKAVATMKKLIAMRPNDPYYGELYGQILLESRNTKPALSAYRNAVNKAPNNALVLGSYGHALLVAGQTAQALGVLEKSRARDFTDARVMRDLGQAYAKQGQPGMASLLVAERYALIGRMKDAGIHARRAVGQLPRGSSGWQRAQDVLSAAEVAAKSRR